MCNDTSWDAAVYSIQEELESIFDRGIEERSLPDFTVHTVCDIATVSKPTEEL